MSETVSTLRDRLIWLPRAFSVSCVAEEPIRVMIAQSAEKLPTFSA